MKVISKARLACLGLLALSALPATALAQSTFQAANAHVFPDGPDVGGAATLIRDDDSINVRLTMSGLDKKASYSVWYIIWNDPENDCAGGPGACTADDLPEVGAVLNAGGFVTGTDGTGYMVGELEVEATPAGLPVFGALTNAQGAEIHLIIKSHGPILAGHVDGQISVPGGPGAFCNPTCTDQFAVAFPPPAP